MSDFDFYDQFGKKMRSLRPSDRTAAEDWEALSHRLDASLPTAQPLHRRWKLAAAALLLLLLGSNLWWGFTFREQDRSLDSLTVQLAALNQKMDAARFPISNMPCGEANKLREQIAALQTDLRNSEAARKKAATGPAFLSFSRGSVTPSRRDTHPYHRDIAMQNQEQAISLTSSGLTTANASTNSLTLAGTESGQPTASTGTPDGLPMLEIQFLPYSHRPPFPLDNDIVMLPAKELPFTQKAVNALLPKSFSIGASGSWLYPLETDMEHQTGYGYGFQAAVGFSRKISLTADWHRATLHYNALAPDAAIGLPTLPLPSPEHDFVQMEVSSQRLTFLGLSLRYKGLPQATWHPFGSIGWSSMRVSPFMAHYETEFAGSIYKDMYHAMGSNKLKSFARLGAGVDFPIGRRFDFSLEGCYLHAWRNGEPDLMGVRMGLNFQF